MTNNAVQEQIDRVITNLRELHPQFKHLISRLTEVITRHEKSKVASELKYSGEYWTKVAYRNALIKLRLILEQNLTFIETLGLLAVTRYVFEVLVWLRVLNGEPRYGLVFYAQVIDKQIQHLEEHKKKLDAEILLFENLHKEESRLSRDAIRRMLKTQADEPEKIAERTAAANQFLMTEIDRKARRSFSLYADEAKRRGYGFQAHLMREQGLKQLQDQIDELKKDWAAFASNCPADIRGLIRGLVSHGKKRRTTWNWKEQAKRAGMFEQYEFLYSYTSRLLHATPVSIFTNQKNLEPEEMRLFLEYVYVSMLDALELGEKQC